MNYWLRLYTGILDDPKVQRLPADQFKGWVNLLCLAKENDGLLPSIGDTAFRLRISEAEAQSLVEELATRGLLDLTDEGVTPHNWEGRQFISDEDPTAALRQRRARAKRDVTRDVTGPSLPSEADYRAETETESETEQSREASRAPRRSVSRPKVCDEEFFAELQANPAYSVFDVKAIYHRMVAWCNVKGKQPTRARLVNWLNREDRPMTAKPRQPNAYVGQAAPAPVEDLSANSDYMAEYVDDLISRGDFIQLGNEYDAIIQRGGAKAEWEIAVVAYYELHKNEPASPEQMAGLTASIQALVNR